MSSKHNYVDGGVCIMSELRTNRIIPRDGLTSGAYGGVIQVKQSILDTSAAIATGHNFADSGLAVTITPTRSDSRIFIMSDITCGLSNGYGGCLRLLRGSTHIYKGLQDGSSGNRPVVTKWFCDHKGASETYSTYFPHFEYIDSPGTTSPVTYKIQLAAYSTVVVYVNRNHVHQNSSEYDGLQASSITAMELSG
tara:strand:- start:491 stop:1072 length:582 start_codon:yes stop_codon:yes gene_type:complete